ncbi:hypothetical protein ACFXJ8_43610 [Nonomuraea sp. NPDC059194]|uniref:hypothetical protein n=1 Tax=Nonomuraea sp. NPDC059194 TaxID=3346764 RepID=UPI003688D6D8
MQSPGTGDDMRLTFYCKDPDSKTKDDCPSFYRTSRGSWVVQGNRQGESVAVQLHALRDDETFVEIPEALAERFVHMYVEERYGVDLGQAAIQAAHGRTRDPQA